ncbi:MAG: NAD(P)H-dependent oxidoreductase [Betaproteobacteria bacterium]|nr:NAD(P)H-dependent oxidoreductase [Betaproteobacteria bacterium]
MASKQDILDAFNFRHACKEFDVGKKIDAADFEFILETGRLSPSSFGFEPWRFVVIQDMALRERLLPATWGAKKQFPTASHVIAILVRKGDMRYDSDYLRHFMHDVKKLSDEAIEARTGVFRKFQESDFKLLDSERAMFDWGCKQAYIALANMMTGAAMIGIDSCPIEGFDMAGAEKVLSEAGIVNPHHFGLAVMVAFGYRKNPQPEKTRQAMSQVVQWVE